MQKLIDVKLANGPSSWGIDASDLHESIRSKCIGFGVLDFFKHFNQISVVVILCFHILVFSSFAGFLCFDFCLGQVGL